MSSLPWLVLWFVQEGVLPFAGPVQDPPEKTATVLVWQGGGGRSQDRDGPQSLLKAAVLERESGHPEKALELCRRVAREFPDDPVFTPKALVIGGEILLEQGALGEARNWTADAITLFRDDEPFQRRMGLLHRRVLFRLTATQTEVVLKYPRTVNFLLWLQWSVRGLDQAEIVSRQKLFQEEVMRHREDWERPGDERAGARSLAPSGMRRWMEILAASLARDAYAVKGQEMPLLDEVVRLLEERMEVFRRLWSRPTPDPRDQERFDQLLNTAIVKLYQLEKATFRLSIQGDHGQEPPVKPPKSPPPPSQIPRAELESEVEWLRLRVKELEEEVARIQKERARRDS